MKQLFKKNEYCEIQLTEFIEFFNNVKLIQDLKAFLIACSNICVIKSKPQNQQKTREITDQRKESKEENEEEEKQDLKLSKSKSKKRRSQQRKILDQDNAAEFSAHSNLESENHATATK